jgi:C4-dicarboxylate transporter DctQ subunit
VFGIGILWAEEVTLLLSGWLVLYGASYGIKVGAHINVDTIVRLLPSKQQRIVTLIAILCSLVYCVLIIDGSWVYLQKMVKIGVELQDVPIPKWAAHSILVIGYVLLFIRLAQVGWAVVKHEADGFHTSDEAKEALRLLREERAAETARQDRT